MRNMLALVYYYNPEIEFYVEFENETEEGEELVVLCV